MTALARQCRIDGTMEVRNLQKGMDFRDVRYRRAVFHKFYQFHLMYRSHPGGVYFAMPHIAETYNLSMEDKLWIAFINGCSQNIVTTWLIWKKFPHLESTNVETLDKWWNENHQHFKAGSGWDSDRKYFKIGKTGFPQCVASYKEKLAGKSQEDFFMSLCDKNPERSFDMVWDAIKGNVLSFGRLSTFSYLEYLRIMGLPIDCSSLFLEDMSGSKSHRNGLCKVLGRDDLDDHQDNDKFIGYTPETIEWLKEEGKILLDEARAGFNHKDVSYFTLESTFCCYKSWHRVNRRYPNVYMDMMYNRIKYAEKEWPKENFNFFWDMRKRWLPDRLRQEANPNDPGLGPEKQNHYRLTGQPIMMSGDWEFFENPFDDKCWSKSVLESMFA